MTHRIATHRMVTQWLACSLLSAFLHLSHSQTTTPPPRHCNGTAFGTQCQYVCHCEGGVACNVTSGRCPGDKCDHGWKGTNCSIRCIAGKFGPNCSGLCRCEKPNECSRENGRCSGECNVFWNGPSCQWELAKLLAAPEVTLITCGEVMVTWQEWVKDGTGVGRGPVSFYSLMYSNDTRTWTQYSEVYHINGSVTHSINITLPSGAYKFRVDAYQLKTAGDDKVYPAPPGTTSDEIDIFCTSTPTPTTAATTKAPLYFKNITTANVTGNSVLIRWDYAVNISDDVTSLVVTYQHLSVGDCLLDGIVNTTDKIVSSGVSNYELVDLMPNSLYRVTLSLELANTSTEVTPPIDVRTGEVQPSGTIRNLRAQALSSESVKVTWEAPLCRLQGGSLLGYDIAIRPENGANNERVVTSVDTSVEVEGLEPYTEYAVSVRFVNGVGEGNYSDVITVTTMQGLPDAPVNVTLIPSQTSIVVTWSDGPKSRGVIEQYRLVYERGNDNNTRSERIVPVAEGRAITIGDLRPDSLYSMKVSSRTDAGWGNATEANTKTLPRSPGPVTSLVPTKANMTCISIRWGAPAAHDLPVLYYMVSFRITRTYSSTNVDNSTQERKVANTSQTADICDLVPSSLYAFTVSMVNKNGVSDPREITAWTVIGSPPTPNPIKTLAKTNTTITISIDPVNPSKLEGPLLHYRIDVNKTIDAKRRKRAIGVYTTAILKENDLSEKRIFIVGDGKTYNGHKNWPLEQSTRYNIMFVVVTRHLNVTKMAYTTVAETTDSFRVVTPSPSTDGPIIVPVPTTESVTNNDNSILIVILVILFMLVLIVIALTLIYSYRRRRTDKEVYATYSAKSADSKPRKDEDLEKYWNKTMSLSDNRYIVAGRDYLPTEKSGVLKHHPPQKDVCSPISFHKEFHSLPHTKKSSNVAKQPQNRSRNRFDHLLPYDHSRVTLKPDENSPNTYINANFIDGVRRKHAYIAAQSPFNEETVLDFWRLIYQKQITVVAMITKLEEEEVIRCTQFWPENQNVATFVNFVLKVDQIEEFAHFVVRRISITGRKEKSVQSVVVLHYKSWPEHGVPVDPYPFIQFMQKIRSYIEPRRTMLVHCGTGVGRTAVFIAVDALIEQYEHDGEVNVFQFVKRMRDNRIGMVRTFRQYVFVYNALFECLCGGKTLLGAGMKEMYRTLREKNLVTNRTFLRDQFVSLVEFTPVLPRTECRDSVQPVNIDKSRYPDVVPPDSHRPVINTLGGVERTDYINAVFIDGYLSKQAFILTQSPLPSTIIDFWKLIHDHNITTIVMMENVFSEDEDVQYWPDDLCSLSVEPYVIESLSEPEIYKSNDDTKDVIVVRSFNLHNKQHPRIPPREINQFQFKAWNGTSFVPQSKTELLDMIEVVCEWQSFSCADTSPVLVHCSDGATQSGLYVAMAVMCETMQTADEADIYHMVRSMKRRRPQIIDQLEQYTFLYKALWDFINLRMSRSLDTGDNPAFSSLDISLFDDVDDADDVTPPKFTFDLYDDYDNHGGQMNGNVVDLYSNSRYRDTEA